MLQGDKWTSVAFKSGNELSGTPQPVLPALSRHSSSCLRSLRCVSGATDLGRVQLSSRSHTHTQRVSTGGQTSTEHPQHTHTHTRIVGFLNKKKTSLDTLRASPRFLRLSQINPIPGVSASSDRIYLFYSVSDVLHPDVELKPQPWNGQTCNVALTFHEQQEHTEFEDEFIQNLLLLLTGHTWLC